MINQRWLKHKLDIYSPIAMLAFWISMISLSLPLHLTDLLGDDLSPFSIGASPLTTLLAGGTGVVVCGGNPPFICSLIFASMSDSYISIIISKDVLAI